MLASRQGHTEALALLLANKADVHAADKVIIIICSFGFILFWK
jgi:ankyrin repeat protein